MDRKLLSNLYETTEFRLLVKELKAMRPLVPAYDPSSVNNVEMMKFQSAKQQEYDALMSIICPSGFDITQN